jgi:hypothetical protein
MMVRKIMGLLVFTLGVGLTSLVWAGVPDLVLSTAVTVATEPVTVYSLPDGAGNRIDACQTLGGGGGNYDATVTLTLLDSSGAPINNYPFEDLWLDSASGGITFCPGGTTADASTDVNGQSTWTVALEAGLCEEYADPQTNGLIVVVNGSSLAQPPLAFGFNSADMDGNLAVNLSDVVLFADALFSGDEPFCADFLWDGDVNLSDVVLLAGAIGASCP